jgi:hypothetical protein
MLLANDAQQVQCPGMFGISTEDFCVDCFSSVKPASSMKCDGVMQSVLAAHPRASTIMLALRDL